MNGSRKRALLSTTVMPLIVLAGVATAATVSMIGFSTPVASAGTVTNPCAAAHLQVTANPCAAGGAPDACYVPRLQTAAAMCTPCGTRDVTDLTQDEAVAAYECLLDELRDAYAKSGDEYAMEYLHWRRYSQRPFVSAMHGNRYVQSYANDTARAYGDYEDAGEMPVGAVSAKDSFSVSANGKARVGPMFLMEKMPEGWHEPSDDWRYTLILPNGQIAGTTNGEGSGNVEFCIGCHKVGTAPEADSLFFVPEDLRVH